MRRPDLHGAEIRRWSLDTGASLLGLGLFLVGLMAPLTPSHGCPSTTAIGVFAAAPALLLFTLASRRDGLARIVLALQGTAVAAGTTWLVVRLGCLG